MGQIINFIPVISKADLGYPRGTCAHAKRGFTNIPPLKAL